MPHLEGIRLRVHVENTRIIVNEEKSIAEQFLDGCCGAVPYTTVNYRTKQIALPVTAIAEYAELRFNSEADTIAGALYLKERFGAALAWEGN